MERAGEETQHHEQTGQSLPAWVGYVVAIALMALLTAGLIFIRHRIPLGNYPVMYTLVVGLVAYLFGEGPAILAFILGLLTFDYFFVAPLHTILPFAGAPQGWASLVAYLLGAIVMGGAMLLIRRSRRRIHEALQRAERELAERARAEAALRESEEKYRALFQNMAEGFALCEMIWDESGLPYDFRYLEVNTAWERQTGLSAAQTVGRTVREVIPGIEPFWIETYGHVARTGESAKVENHVSTLDRWFEVLAYKHSENRFAAIFVDITSRKKAEQALRESETRYRQLSEELELRVAQRTGQLEAANKEMEAFTYSVSHDLRAPLRLIDGFSLALLEDYEDKLDEEGKSYLHFVRDSAQRMARLIDDLLRLSRIGRAEMHFEMVDLSALAESVIAELRQQDPDRRVDVTIQPGLAARGDMGLLRVVLENLLGNAWKYTGKTTNARMEFGMTQQDSERVYFVRDNGAGFDMAYASKLFAPFQRLHTEAEFSGTGIGLSIVRRIITRHGGRVWAEGEVGKGATIYFTLPTEEKYA
jgi:PAS domain S-box-containing protein